MNREIEIKIQLSDDQLIVVRSWLESKATFCAEVQHEEYYLDNPKEPVTFMSPEGFKDAHYFLRVRKSHEKGDSICLKKWHADEHGKKTYCDEWEISVSDGKKVLELFEQLGFIDVTPIKKTRRIYRIDQFEVVIDDVEGLGKFIEVELKQDVESVQDGLKQIYGLIKLMGIKCCTVQERGYTSMAWNPHYNFGKHIDID